MKYIVTLVVCCLTISGISCKKDNKAPIDQLPPATQQGKNTFGCLLNGGAWMPKGSFPLGSVNPSVSYDPTFENGALIIKATRVSRDNTVSITFSCRNIDKAATYPLTVAGNGAPQIAIVKDEKTGCYYAHSDNGTSCEGTLTITKLSMTERVIAGSFSFTISKPGCNTIVVTDGRFDLPL